MLRKLSWQHSIVVWKIFKPAWVVSMSWCEKVNYRKLYHSLWHHSACASITVKQSGHFHVPIYQRLREDQFHAPTDQLCREVNVSFAKISSINSLFDSVFGFLKLEVLWGVWIPKNPKVFAVLADNSHLTAEFTLFIYFLNGQK